MKRPGQFVMERPGQFGTNEFGIKKRPAAVDDNRKDRNKDGWFGRNKHLLDSSMQNMIENSNCKERREIVNAMVVRDEDGGWSFDLENCKVTTKMARYEDNYTQKVRT